MKMYWIFGLSLFTVCAQAAMTLDTFIKKVQNPYFAIAHLKKEDSKSKYLKRDFSEVLKPKSEFLAAIGPDLQRMYVTFKSVKKSEDGYIIEGTTKVKDKTSDFTGMVKPDKIREYAKIEHNDEDGTHSKDKAQGIFFGSFTLLKRSHKKLRRPRRLHDGCLCRDGKRQTPS